MSTKRRAGRILVVDDDLDHAQMLADVLASSGFRARPVGGVREALAHLALGETDVVVTDLRMPETGGLELIEWCGREIPELIVVAITAFGGLETAIKAMRAGAFDYLSKPFEPAALVLAVEKALAERLLRQELATLRVALAASEPIVARSEAMRSVMSVVDQIAPTSVGVVLTGPSGVGKEVVARAIHARSERAHRPFVAVNCAAIPGSLLESELFGVRKGAFTHARVDRKGLFREADGGTLFLDEIGDLPLALQPKLLRVLQEREVRPLGGAASSSVDVRVLAATRLDLRKALEDGSFREDLFYRLAVVELHIPALRERREDIAPLAEAALLRASARSKRPHRTLSGAAARRIMEYGWPGNVRELENAIARAVALSQGDAILPEDLPPTVTAILPHDFLEHAFEQSWTLDDLSRAYLGRVLERTGGNRKQAAEIMNINRRTIQRWLGEPAEEVDEPTNPDDEIDR